MDKETEEVLRQGEKLARFVKGDEWAMVKDVITNEIMDLQSINNLDGNADPQEVILDIKARKVAVDILLGVIREIEGRADQHKHNQQTEGNTDEIINRR